MSYEQGFIEKCAQYGVDPYELLKWAHYTASTPGPGYSGELGEPYDGSWSGGFNKGRNSRPGAAATTVVPEAQAPTQPPAKAPTQPPAQATAPIPQSNAATIVNKQKATALRNMVNANKDKLQTTTTQNPDGTTTVRRQGFIPPSAGTAKPTATPKARPPQTQPAQQSAGRSWTAPSWWDPNKGNQTQSMTVGGKTYDLPGWVLPSQAAQYVKDMGVGQSANQIQRSPIQRKTVTPKPSAPVDVPLNERQQRQQDYIDRTEALRSKLNK